jgi:hypothetical protein
MDFQYLMKVYEAAHPRGGARDTTEAAEPPQLPHPGMQS